MDQASDPSMRFVNGEMESSDLDHDLPEVMVSLV